MIQIPLTGKHGVGKFALVDNEDYDRVNQHQWWLGKFVSSGGSIYYYPLICIGGKHVYLHQFIMGVRGVDHKNGDTLNNTRNNLRLASASQNSANRRKQQTKNGKSTSSQYKGVNWDRRRDKWVVTITSNGKTVNLGGFDSEIEAAQSYNEAALHYFGEFAKVNVMVGY